MRSMVTDFVNTTKREFYAKRVLLSFTCFYFVYLLVLSTISKKNAFSLTLISGALLFLIVIMSIAFTRITFFHKYSLSNSMVGSFLDLFPLFLLWFGYESFSKVKENLLYHRVNTLWLYETEQFLFRWLFNSSPNEWFATTFNSPIVDLFFGLFYLLHVFPPFVLTVFFILKKDKFNYFYLMYNLLLFCLLCYITFVIFPTSPPWYFREYGTIKPSVGINYSEHVVADLKRAESLLGIPIFSFYYGNFESNAFAALPSMHAGLMYVSTFSTAKKEKKTLWIMIPFTLIILFGALYFYHHYILDLLVAGIYAIISHYTTLILCKKTMEDDIHKEAE